MTATEYAQEIVNSFDRANGRRVVDVLVDDAYPLYANIIFHDQTSQPVTGMLAVELRCRVHKDAGLASPYYDVVRNNG